LCSSQQLACSDGSDTRAAEGSLCKICTIDRIAIEGMPTQGISFSKVPSMTIVVFLFFMIGAICATVFTGKITRVVISALLGAWSILSFILAFKLYGARGAEGGALFPVPDFVVSGLYLITSFAWAFILLSWRRHALFRIAAVFSGSVVAAAVIYGVSSVLLAPDQMFLLIPLAGVVAYFLMASSLVWILVCPAVSLYYTYNVPERANKA
jgi:hypothetical protein